MPQTKGKIMKTIILEKFLEKFLETGKFNDSGLNGLQVEANDEVSKIALGVSASMALFKMTRDIGADAVIVHHGLFWNKQIETLKGVTGKRIQFLFKNNISLFGYHLPLDSHPQIGNNACIADSLKLKKRSFFAKHGGIELGIIGNLQSAYSLDKIARHLHSFFGQINHAYFYGKKTVKRIAIVSGGAASDVYEAYEKGADLFITGETGEPMQEWCREAEINYIAAGHYASEQSGIQKLGAVISRKFKIPCQFAGVPNRV